MTRARGPSGPTISLFPFLAVLLCTMGALLVLLVLFSRSVRRGDEADQAAAAGQGVADLELARSELEWRIGRVQEIRERTAADLARARMQLAGTEETARALADELAALERIAAALAGAEGDEPADREVAELERLLAAARETLEEAKDAAESRPPAYAVVPYEGANGTHRRPLYIECCIDGVFLQPEGLRLGPADFDGPPGPGNPLASALRAAREHIARTPGESGDPGAQPYPLLLVRPSGVMAYYAAREAIQSWGSEFGYQFIDEDWEIAYPAPDPALAQVEQRAVEEARRRLEWLAQVRPAKPSRPATTYRAATTRGGVVSNGGPSVLGDQSRWDWTEGQAAGAARQGRGSGGSGDGTGGLDAAGSASGGDAILGGAGAGGKGFRAGTGGQGSEGGGDGVIGGRYAGPSKFYSGGDGDAAGAAAGAGATNGLAGGGSPGFAAGGAGAGDATSPGPGGGSSGAAGNGPGGGSESGTAAGSTAGGAAGGGAGSTAGAGAGGGGGAMAAGAAGGGGGGSFGPSMPGLHQPGGASAGGTAAAGGAAGSLAGRRGSNWASLATQDRPIPLTRPIRLECAAQEFRILGDGGRVQARIPIGTHTVDAIDPLVREVHATVARWGIAGDRMYWKPELVLTATLDGGSRRDDLERLLADSGIDTRRVDETARVRHLPPVSRTGGILRPR